jgi:hypothetical protein
MYALRACKGNMQRAEDFVKKMEEGIKMKSPVFETLEKKKEMAALPNDEVQAQSSCALVFEFRASYAVTASQALQICLFLLICVTYCRTTRSILPAFPQSRCDVLWQNWPRIA